MRQTDATRFLRGVQVTDKKGLVEFATLYPGWYSGRAIHIHMKVHLGGHVSHTGQLFFPGRDYRAGRKNVAVCEARQHTPDDASGGRHFQFAARRGVDGEAGAVAEFHE